ncbi:DNA repair protein XRCC1-like isoform X2 [Macrobrachium rosenbergii]|uniref:DNA repair protein XRCC1-like isoform X2 n=1 Tax=Macrobrachium rosenbergii TaxID=79674 RepID=UPI0034D6EB35
MAEAMIEKNHPADNMLSAETFRKWRCAQDSCGKQATVTLKLERLSSIHSVDIGNNGSAFVEVLVAREGVDYQVLLVASSFMTPGESRNSSDINRVRMFGPDKLNKNIAEQKWDRVKVICTQPFNKTLQFGLSFVTVTAPSEGSANSSPKVIRLGSFTLKDEEEEDPISVGSIFARRREKETSSPLTGAAAIRAASASAVSSGSTPDSKKTKPINAPEVGFYQLKKNASPAPERLKPPQPSTPSSSDAHEERGKEKRKERDRDSDKHRERDKRSKDSESRVEKDREKQKKDKNSDRNSSSESNKRKNDSRDLKRTSSQENKRPSPPSSSSASSGSSSKRKTAPFASLLKGVTFVLSGYQNPLRSQIRDMMLEMGARYKPDWEPSCTHLICAFANTPKYQQVKGKGKIVTAKWISDCHKNKIRYPWRRYALPKQDDARESEEEIWAEELFPKEEKPKPSSKRVDSDVEESQYDKDSNEAYSDNEDTDDEIQRVLAKQKNTKNTSDEEKVQKQKPNKSTSSSEEPPNKKIKVETSDRNSQNTADTCKAGGTRVKQELNGNGNEDSVYDDDTDIDEENVELVTKPDTSSLPLPTLGDYLKGKCLFIYGNMSSDMKHLLGRYIVAFDGVLEDYMTEKVNFVITEDEWDDNFDNALADNPSLQFVKPAWIWRCSDKQKLVPFQPFMVVPKD